MINIHPIYDPDTFTMTYIVSDFASKSALVIDPVLNYNASSGEITHHSVDLVSAYLQAEHLTLRYILETHAHADHLSGAQVIKARHQTESSEGDSSVKIGICHRITEIQEVFRPLFDMPERFRCDGSQFDLLLHDGEILRLGETSIKVIETPGHTPACVCYHIEDVVFTGDALFMHDYGVGRCDFPRGSAATLYSSVHDTLYSLPDETRVFVGHDYQPRGRELQYETTIGVSKLENAQLSVTTSRDAFIEMRESRDKTLNTPRLLYPSLQVNIRAGHLPERNSEGMRALVIPLKGEV